MITGGRYFHLRYKKSKVVKEEVLAVDSAIHDGLIQGSQFQNPSQLYMQPQKEFNANPPPRWEIHGEFGCGVAGDDSDERMAAVDEDMAAARLHDNSNCILAKDNICDDSNSNMATNPIRNDPNSTMATTSIFSLSNSTLATARSRSLLSRRKWPSRTTATATPDRSARQMDLERRGDKA
ncbi:hypothetical protein K432DRAFT_427089 [Lepidopterella palustris CBS 459.81]|uniref:Uncharacterized protein n=1 Tax=Lepidopterella palustris CBS 459.81 TaxID=1314670 RepID=A0A8E2E7P3_9PEZI|nr:hypothetical protein K432DRAFT_427089 [Lepidopterella palustris CBS 459.81]